MDTIPFYATEITGIIIALGGIALGIQKLFKHWKITSAESSIVSMMHTELERVGSQNRLLAEELNKLQLEIINLNKQLRTMSIENNKLYQQVTNLNSEVCRLQTLLNKHKDFKENPDDFTS